MYVRICVVVLFYFLTDFLDRFMKLRLKIRLLSVCTCS